MDLLQALNYLVLDLITIGEEAEHFNYDGSNARSIIPLDLKTKPCPADFYHAHHVNSCIISQRQWIYIPIQPPKIRFVVSAFYQNKK
jgi:hypothetical protein